MSEERLKILQMLADGKISAADADRLLAKLEGVSHGDSRRRTEPRQRGRCLRIEVEERGRRPVNVRVPLGFVRAGLKLGTIVPSKVRERLAERGIEIPPISPETLDELDVRIDDGNDGRVRIYCE
jgi:hypothetical protein